MAIVQADTSGIGGSWIFNPYPVAYTNALAGGNFLLGMAGGVPAPGDPLYITAISDTQNNSWTNLSLGENGYGIGYALTSNSGSDTVDFLAQGAGINTHSPCGIVLEISDIPGFGFIQTTSGSGSQASGSVTTPQGTTLEFTSVATYDTWFLNFVYLPSSRGAGLVLAIPYSDTGVISESISGWTLEAVPQVAVMSVYAQAVSPIIPAPVRVFINAGATRPLSSFQE